MTTWTSSQNFR